MTFKEFKEKLFSRILWGNCLGMVVASVAVVAGSLGFIGFYTRHGEAVHMPDVKGQDAEVAMRKLEALGLCPEVGDTGYVATLPADVILDQSVEPNEEIKPGRRIRLKINSRNVEMVKFPDVAGNSSLREAEAKLTQAGFKLTVPERIKGDKDWVYEVKVNGKPVFFGSRVPAQSAVTLVVGNGDYEDEFNGNDSLDFAIFGSDSELPADESVGVEEDEPASVPVENEAE